MLDNKKNAPNFEWPNHVPTHRLRSPGFFVLPAFYKTDSGGFKPPLSLNLQNSDQSMAKKKKGAMGDFKSLGCHDSNGAGLMA